MRYSCRVSSSRLTSRSASSLYELLREIGRASTGRASAGSEKCSRKRVVACRCTSPPTVFTTWNNGPDNPSVMMTYLYNN